MRNTITLRHESQVRTNDVCTHNSDSVDVNPCAKKGWPALNDYVAESTRLLEVPKKTIRVALMTQEIR